MAALNDLLGLDMQCGECGRRHKVAVREVVVADDALERLPDVCNRHAPGRRVALVADRRTLAIAGDAARAALDRGGFTVTVTIVPDPKPDHSPVCDDTTKAWLEPQVPVADLYVAVGSGVVCDLVKWIGFERKIPYVCVATAASMNGYASDNVAPTIQGVKCLFSGVGPRAILSTPQILAAAPRYMTVAGLGDVMAKPVSASDWRLNRELFGEFYCSVCADTINDIEPLYLACPEDIGRGKPEAVRLLFDALVLTGLSMSMAGTSSPASGGEHLVSHTLDMMSMLDGVPHDLHGRQVGVATILGAAIYQELMALEKPVFRDSSTPTSTAFWGRFTAAVEPYHAKKRAKTAEAAGILQRNPARWDRIRQRLAPGLRSPEKIKDVLKRAGAAHRIEDIGVTRERFLKAFTHAHEFRDRITILDLARIAGLMPARAEDLVDRWVMR